MDPAQINYSDSFRIAILALILLYTGLVIAFLLVRRRWQQKQKVLEQELANSQNVIYEKLYSALQSTIAHENNKGLNYILNKSTETLDGLGMDQASLREKQSGIIAKAHDMQQHDMNILSVFTVQPDKIKKELLNIRQLVESVLLELFPYAESQGVTLRTTLQDLEPVFLDPGLTTLAVRNLVHNAIKYSERGRVVEVTLNQGTGTAASGKEITFLVKDHGRGIPQADWERIFELNRRGDGLVETGSGLGLYCARMAARLQHGDVTVASSILKEGSVFQLILPAATVGETAPEAEDRTKSPPRKRALWIWILIIAGLLAAAALWSVIYESLTPGPTPTPTILSQKVTIKSYHNRYVTALGQEDNWALTQVETPDACATFTMIERDERVVALLTCHGRYITAPVERNDNLVNDQHDSQWLLRQETGPGDCGLFTLEPQSNGKVAFLTCSSMVVTAGDGNWPGDMAWKLVAETDEIIDWEKFTLELLP